MRPRSRKYFKPLWASPIVTTNPSEGNCGPLHIFFFQGKKRNQESHAHSPLLTKKRHQIRAEFLFPWMGTPFFLYSLPRIDKGGYMLGGAPTSSGERGNVCREQLFFFFFVFSELEGCRSWKLTLRTETTSACSSMSWKCRFHRSQSHSAPDAASSTSPFRNSPSRAASSAAPPLEPFARGFTTDFTYSSHRLTAVRTTSLSMESHLRPSPGGVSSEPAPPPRRHRQSGESFGLRPRAAALFDGRNDRRGGAARNLGLLERNTVVPWSEYWVDGGDRPGAPMEPIKERRLQTKGSTPRCTLETQRKRMTCTISGFCRITCGLL